MKGVYDNYEEPMLDFLFGILESITDYFKERQARRNAFVLSQAKNAAIKFLNKDCSGSDTMYCVGGVVVDRLFDCSTVYYRDKNGNIHADRRELCGGGGCVLTVVDISLIKETEPELYAKVEEVFDRHTNVFDILTPLHQGVYGTPLPITVEDPYAELECIFDYLYENFKLISFEDNGQTTNISFNGNRIFCLNLYGFDVISLTTKDKCISLDPVIRGQEVLVKKIKKVFSRKVLRGSL